MSRLVSIDEGLGSGIGERPISWYCNTWEGSCACLHAAKIKGYERIESVKPAWREPTAALPAKGLLPRRVTPHPRLRLHKALPASTWPTARLIVYVPPGYDRHPERRILCVYMQEDRTSRWADVVHSRPTWQMREHADAAIEAAEVEPLVIVGIYNAGDRRIEEYTHERAGRMGGGGAEQYGRALTEEILPWIATTTG